MRKTILTHFYNEEYILPWWLNHHKSRFDWGVCINYSSTDRSVEIIKDICPKWVVVDSVNDSFDAKLCDEEVIKYEQQIPGWKIVLNTTEFLVGNYDILNDVADQEIRIPCVVMVDEDPSKIPKQSVSLIKQKRFGIPYDAEGPIIRRPRCIHNKKQIDYPLGRHYEKYDTDELKILWYGYSPYTTELKTRKLQIQNRIPQVDRMRGLGTQHFVTSDQLDSIYNQYRQQAINVFER